ncbi:MAG: Rab5-interacting protein-domain-containing protein, partial [Olpidium bornovanus]
MDNGRPNINGAAVLSNAQDIGQARSSMAMVFGAAAGVLGLTNWSGLLFYAAASTLMSAALLVFAAKGRPDRYLRHSYEIWTEGVLGGLFSYVLFWTFLYGLVHVEERVLPSEARWAAYLPTAERAHVGMAAPPWCPLAPRRFALLEAHHLLPNLERANVHNNFPRPLDSSPNSFPAIYPVRDAREIQVHRVCGPILPFADVNKCTSERNCVSRVFKVKGQGVRRLTAKVRPVSKSVGENVLSDGFGFGFGFGFGLTVTAQHANNGRPRHVLVFYTRQNEEGCGLLSRQYRTDVDVFRGDVLATRTVPVERRADKTHQDQVEHGSALD